MLGLQPWTSRVPISPLPLLAPLTHQSLVRAPRWGGRFRKLSKDVQRYGQKCIDEGKEFSPMAAVKHKTISNGLKYALATGNWGQQKSAPGSIRAGVSQVFNDCI